jgi:hypothetical protein
LIETRQVVGRAVFSRRTDMGRKRSGNVDPPIRFRAVAVRIATPLILTRWQLPGGKGGTLAPDLRLARARVDASGKRPAPPQRLRWVRPRAATGSRAAAASSHGHGWA